MQPSGRNKRNPGLSRREMEWVVEGMLRQMPKDPAAMAKALCDVMMTLVEKNNALLARNLAPGGAAEGEEGERR